MHAPSQESQLILIIKNNFNLMLCFDALRLKKNCRKKTKSQAVDLSLTKRGILFDFLRDPQLVK
jgi:hypothetical protein